MTSQPIFPKPVDAHSSSDQISIELSMRRTGLSFHRTRLSVDRTTMSVIRTSLSLISFGFTLFQIFKKLAESGVVKSGSAARNFGETLVFMGIGMLILGIGSHIYFMVVVRREREMLRLSGLVHAESGFPLSLPLIISVVLLGVGIAAIVAMLTGAGPLG